ncbi:MAG: hypothetical protein ACRD5H_03445 [Nitrososphaerales archaeon]
MVDLTLRLTNDYSNLFLALADVVNPATNPIAMGAIRGAISKDRVAIEIKTEW